MKFLFLIIIFLTPVLIAEDLEKNKEGEEAIKGEANKKVIYEEKTKIDFEDTLIEGQLKKSNATFFSERKSAKFDSLVKKKKNFRNLIMKTGDRL